MGKWNKYKKTNKSMSAKKLAEKAMRAVNKMEADEETKWFDQSYGGTIPFGVIPFTSTTALNSVVPLTDIQPRQSVNTVTGAGLPTINTSNYRDGARVYISGVYIKMQFFYRQIRNSATERYPPFTNISWAVVRELKNSSAVQPYTTTVIPTPSMVWQDPAAVGQSTPAPWTQNLAPLASLLFRNMNNGHNYKILKKGCFCLAAPTMTQQGPRSTTTLPGAISESSFGSRPSTTSGVNQTLPHQYSNNACKTISVKLHPKTKCRYRQLPEQVDDQTAVTLEEYTPLENGLYLMFWSDVGEANGDSRFYNDGTGAYTIVPPQVLVNTRIRFKDV